MQIIHKLHRKNYEKAQKGNTNHYHMHKLSFSTLTLLMEFSNWSAADIVNNNFNMLVVLNKRKVMSIH